MTVAISTPIWMEPTRILRPFALVWEAWRHLNPQHFLLALLVGLAFAVVDNLVTLGVNLFGPSWKLVAATCIDNIARFLVLPLAIIVADQVQPRRLPQWFPYVMAVTIAALASSIAAELIKEWLNLRNVWRQPASMFWVPPAYGFVHACLLTGLVTFIYVQRRQAMQQLAALRGTQLDHAKRGREMLQSRLQVMQARVEPQFLFNTLAQVERLYQTEPRLAGSMLDDLIVYLRAALPLLRESTSTLAKEIELVRAYLGIMQIRLKERLAFDIDVPDAIKNARMPPMMLLPLIDHAIVHGLEPSKAGGTITIGTSVEGGKLRLIVADSGAGFVPRLGDEGIQQIRERIAALYGDAASLKLSKRATQGTEATMEIPYERT